jgi:hypothetical protein
MPAAYRETSEPKSIGVVSLALCHTIRQPSDEQRMLYSGMQSHQEVGEELFFCRQRLLLAVWSVAVG